MVDVKWWLDAFRGMAFTVLLGALLISWHTGNVWTFIGLLGVMTVLLGIVLNVMYTINNPANGFPEDGDRKDYPGFPRKWHRAHMVVVVTTRLLARWAL